MELAQLKKSATAIRAAFEACAVASRKGAEGARAALAATFADQAALESAGYDAYTAIRDAAEEGYLKGGGTEGSFRVTWKRALEACKLQAIDKSGKPSNRGKGGGKVKAAPQAAPAGAKSKISDEEAATHFFGHSDAKLIRALLLAGANELAFLRFAETLEKPEGKPEGAGELKAA